MDDAAIPTMPCPECDGCGDLAMVGRKALFRFQCPDCYGAGRIPRPPLTTDQVDALPDGARVVVQLRYGFTDMEINRGMIGSLTSMASEEPWCRVWLAEDAV